MGATGMLCCLLDLVDLSACMSVCLSSVPDRQGNGLEIRMLTQNQPPALNLNQTQTLTSTHAVVLSYNMLKRPI